MDETKKKRKMLLGVLIMCVGLQIAGYGTAVCVTGEIQKMDAAQFYVLVSAMGSLGMMLVLPMVGKLTMILGLRNLIFLGILIQLGGRIVMMFSGTWIPYALGYLVQSVGGGMYVSSAYVILASFAEPKERAKYFAYIPVANAIGAIFGPILVSALYDGGGMAAKFAYILNLPITVIGFLMIYKGCDNKKNSEMAKGFDYPGLVLTVAGIGLTVLWMNLSGKMFAWISLPSAIMLICAVACMVILIRRELTIDNPSVPVRMFANKRLTSAFICAVVTTAYATCSASYSIMWIRTNYSEFPGSTMFNGTASLPQQVVMVILGMGMGAFIGKQFIQRFRAFGILSNIALMIATGILFCLRFTGTAATGDVKTIGSLPVGMLLIWIAVAIGGFAQVVTQSTYSVFWQTNTPKEDIPSGQALYNFGATGGSVLFGAVCGAVLGTSGDFSRAFAVGFVFACIGLIVAITQFRFTEEEKARA